jgi:hypothetical protein
MLCVVQALLRQFAADDVVDGREHEVVDRREVAQRLGKGGFVADVRDHTLDAGIDGREPRQGSIEFALVGGDDRDASA